MISILCTFCTEQLTSRVLSIAQARFIVVFVGELFVFPLLAALKHQRMLTTRHLPTFDVKLAYKRETKR